MRLSDVCDPPFRRSVHAVRCCRVFTAGIATIHRPGAPYSSGITDVSAQGCRHSRTVPKSHAHPRCLARGFEPNVMKRQERRCRRRRPETKDKCSVQGLSRSGIRQRPYRVARIRRETGSSERFRFGGILDGTRSSRKFVSRSGRSRRLGIQIAISREMRGRAGSLHLKSYVPSTAPEPRPSRFAKMAIL